MASVISTGVINARYLTSEQAAALLGVSTRTLRSRTKAGILKPTREGKFVRFEVAEIERYLSEIEGKHTND